MEQRGGHIQILAIAVAAMIGVAAMLGLASCGESQTSAELRRIGLLTEEHPDSALRLLLAVDTAAFRTEAERARYAVALTNARYLAYDPDCSDSLLRLHAPYFADAPADRDKMLYLYLRATFLTEQKLYTEAIIDLFDAAQIAEASDDHLYAGRIYRAIRDIYFNTFNFEQALKYSWSALDEFEKSKSEYLYIWAVADVSICLHNLGYVDSGYQMLDTCIKYSFAKDNYPMKAEFLQSAAHTLFQKKEYREAINHLRCIPLEYDSQDLFILSRSYLELNEPDSASYFDKLMQERNIYKYESKYAIEKYNGNYEEALIELEKTLAIQSDTMRYILGNNIAGVEGHYFEKESIVYKYKFDRQIIITTFVIGLFIISTILIYFYHHGRLKFKESQIEKYAIIAKNLQTKFDKLSSDTNNLIKSDFTLINKLSQEFFLNENSNTNKFYSKVQKIIEEYRSSDATLNLLEQDVDLTYNGLATRFKNEMPDIYKIFNRLFLLIALNFDSQSIPVILGVTQRAYYNKKNRLVSILRDSDTHLSDQLLIALKSSREKKQNRLNHN